MHNISDSTTALDDKLGKAKNMVSKSFKDVITGLGRILAALSESWNIST